MIYYWIHIVFVYICSKLFWSKVSLTSNLSRKRTVSIFDCDTFRYMANSRYLYYMDLIRFEILFRTKLYENTVKKGMYAVIGSQKIIYKKPLKRWTTFKIELILEGWDDKWVYHSQVFTRKNEVYAIGYTKVAFWKHKKAQDMNQILKKSGVTIPQKLIPAKMHRMFDDDYHLLKNINPTTAKASLN